MGMNVVSVNVQVLVRVPVHARRGQRRVPDVLHYLLALLL